MPWKRDESWNCAHHEGTRTASGFRSVSSSSEQRQQTLLTYVARTHARTYARRWTQTALKFLFVCFQCFIHGCCQTPPPHSSLHRVGGQEDRRWPPFQLGGSSGSPRLFEKEKSSCHSARLLSCLPQNVCWHKALILVAAHSHSTANKCDLLSPASHRSEENKKRKSSLTSTLPSGIEKKNKINENNVLGNTARPWTQA